MEKKDLEKINAICAEYNILSVEDYMKFFETQGDRYPISAKEFPQLKDPLFLNDKIVKAAGLVFFAKCESDKIVHIIQMATSAARLLMLEKKK